MGFFLPALASAFINKVVGGGGGQQQQQQQQPNFQFGPRPPRYRYQGMPMQAPPFVEQPGYPQINSQAPQADPITAAMMGGDSQYKSTDRPRTPQSGDNRFNFKDEFLSNLTQGLVQRILFGGGQQAPSYSPPQWR